MSRARRRMQTGSMRLASPAAIDLRKAQRRTGLNVRIDRAGDALW